MIWGNGFLFNNFNEIEKNPTRHKLTLGYWYFIGILNAGGRLNVTYLLGIDGGGTGCRAALADLSGNVLGTGKSGSANIMTDMNTARLNILNPPLGVEQCDQAKRGGSRSGSPIWKACTSVKKAEKSYDCNSLGVNR